MISTNLGNMPSDMTYVSSVSKSDFLTSSILVIPGQCNFRCSREERMKASPRRLKTETFGQRSTPLQKTSMFGGPEVNYHRTHSARNWLSILRTTYTTQNLQRKRRTDFRESSCNSGDGTGQMAQPWMFMMMMMNFREEAMYQTT